MTKEKFDILLDKWLSQKLSKEEINQFLDLLQDNNHKDMVATSLDQYFAEPSSELSSEQERRDILNKLLETISTPVANNLSPVLPVHRVHFLRKWRWAAAIIFALGLGAYLFSTSKKTEQPLVSDSKPLQKDIAPGTNRAVLNVDNKQIDLASDKTGITVADNIVTYTDGQQLSNAGNMLTLTTPKGGQYQLVLPDGSKVWLNAASSIKFPAVFSGETRHIKVTGEAYMEIAQNAKQPFIVNTNGSEIQVLGTNFNINAYEDEAAVKTTLVSGSVKVNRQVILKPGQQCIVAEGKSQVVNNANLDQILAWKNGLFNFDGLDIKAVMKQLERWYDIKVQYNNSFSNVIFRGEIYRNISLSAVLEALKEMHIETKLNGRTLVVL